ncbi:MAG: hypothetical protein SGJ18_02320 [Pseudomonadota bacterium]|nr:hypothetical protein [Pseudomonadota bacterium]
MSKFISLLTIFAFHFSGHSAYANTCSEHFISDYIYNIELLTNAGNFRYSDFATQKEGRLSWKLNYTGPNPSGINRKITISQSKNPVKNWVSSKLTFQGNNYRLINVGMRQMKSDIESGHKKLKEIYRSQTTDSFIFESSGEVQEARSVLVKYRWTAHNAILGLYRKLKGSYLSEDDFKRLELFNIFNENSDVFILLREPSKNLSELSESEIESHLLMTIQVSYSKGKLEVVPRPGQLTKNDPSREFTSLLPFQERLSENISFRTSHLKKILNAKWPAEFTRYGQFQAVPSQVKAKFLRDVLLMAGANGADAFVATGDSHTSRLFNIFYGFTKIDQPLATNQNKEKEFINYLTSSGQNYLPTLRKLEEKANQVISTPVNF